MDTELQRAEKTIRIWQERLEMELISLEDSKRKIKNYELKIKEAQDKLNNILLINQ